MAAESRTPMREGPRIVDIIARTRDGVELSRQEIEALVLGYTRGDVPDYQVAAWLMAALLKGLTPRETVLLTETMARSGACLTWPESLGVVADKHSTGGVGDKTSLVVVPLVAALGVPVAKMSGRGLGHTGGTIDKLESIPGLQVNLDIARFQAQVEQVGLAIVAQSPDLAPADGKLYALRDVTATVPCLPLIASSVMSKKLAAGAHVIVLDVKTGSGAFMPTLDDARRLSRTMIDLGTASGRRVRAVISAMDQPLGAKVGHSLELQEAVATLRGEGPADLTELAFALAGHVLALARPGVDREQAHRLLRSAITSGAALEKLRAMVAAQGGDPAALDEWQRLPAAPVRRVAEANRAGYVAAVSARAVGEAVVRLGGGRAKKGDAIDLAVGVDLAAKTGTWVARGDPLFTVHARDEAGAEAAESAIRAAYVLADAAPVAQPVVLDTIG